MSMKPHCLTLHPRSVSVCVHTRSHTHNCTVTTAATSTTKAPIKTQFTYKPPALKLPYVTECECLTTIGAIGRTPNNVNYSEPAISFCCCCWVLVSVTQFVYLFQCFLQRPNFPLNILLLLLLMLFIFCLRVSWERKRVSRSLTFSQLLTPSPQMLFPFKWL